jgi:outer membrane protein assembly factor BamD (BamD/ComL family)
MGGKPVWPGQQVFLCLALLGLVSGCSLLTDLRERAEIRDAMLQGQALFARGDFSGALKEYQRVQSLAQEATPSDAASFNIALIYADPRNPQKDNQKAMGAFQGVIARYPESPWADQSRIWIAAFEDLGRSQREIEESKLALEKSKQVIKQSRREVEKSKQLLDQSKQEIDKLKQEVEKSKQVLEKSRQVDIEIEQKRRIRGK